MEPEKPAAQLTIIAVGTEPESERSDESHTVAPNLSSTDSTLQAALYQVVANRRLGYIRRSSYRLWMCGLGLFAFAALGIIVTSLVNVVPLWAEIVTFSR